VGMEVFGWSPVLIILTFSTSYFRFYLDKFGECVKVDAWEVK